MSPFTFRPIFAFLISNLICAFATAQYTIPERFQEINPYNFGYGSQSSCPRVADINGDGLTDLISTTTNSVNPGTFRIAICLNRGEGPAQPPIISVRCHQAEAFFPVAADFDLDGTLDIACNSRKNIIIYKNNNGLRFEGPEIYNTGTANCDLTTIEVNNDGYPDLAVSDGEDEVLRLFENKGDGTFHRIQTLPTGPWVYPLLTDDYDEDGYEDVLLFIPGKEIRFLKNKGNGRLHSGRAIPTEKGPSEINTGDVDSDGDLDIVVASSSHELFLLFNEGFPAFRESPPISKPDDDIKAIQTADLDMDEDADIVLATKDRLSIWENDGLGNYSLSMRRPFPYCLYDVACSDIDNDNDPDILLTPYRKGPPALTGVIFNTPGRPKSVDCNENGREDSMEIELGQAEDCNNNSIPDECEIKAQVNFPTPGFYDLNASGTEYMSSPDIDADGIPDIACLEYDHLRFFRNSGNKRFSYYGEVTNLPGPYRMTFSDLNKDNLTDFAVAHTGINGNEEIAAVSVFLNPGDASFYRPQTIMFAAPLETPVHALTTADVSGDGSNDIILSLRAPGGHQITVLFNDGSGAFSSPVDIAQVEGAYRIIAEDFDNDGDRDIAALHGYNEDSKVHLLWNQGEGTFKDPESIEVEARLRDFCVLHADGNNLPDLALLCRHQGLKLFVNDNNHTFSPYKEIPLGPSLTMEKGDLNNDGLQDLVFTSNAYATVALRTEKGGEFTLYRYNTGSNPRYTTVRDLDNDGYQDLAMLRFSNDLLHVFWNDGKGIFSAPRRISSGDCFKIADLDNDNDSDVITVFSDSFDTVFYAYLNNGRGMFNQVFSCTLPNEATGIHAADINGDLLVDAVVECWTNIYWLRNLGKGSFEKPVRIEEGDCLARGKTILSINDLDGDNDLDLAAGKLRSGEENTQIYFNDGNGHFTCIPLGHEYYFVSGIWTGDLDGDEDNDIAISASELAEAKSMIYVFFNDGTGSFTLSDKTYGKTYGGPLQKKINGGDIDHDGDCDLIATERHQMTILNNRGNGTFDEPRSYGLADIKSCAEETGDINNDGIRDVVLGKKGGIALFLNKGDGLFGLPEVFRPFSVERYVAFTNTYPEVADLNGDGYLDIVFSDHQTSSVSFLVNKTQPPLSPDRNGDNIPDICTLPSFRRGDINADQDIDLSDAVYLLNYLFRNGPPPPCMKTADVNDNGTIAHECDSSTGYPGLCDRGIDLSDAVHLMCYLFFQGPAPGAPFPECGIDRTEDNLTCETYPGCD